MQTIETWQANSSTGNIPMAIKNSVPMATHSFPVPIHLTSMLGRYGTQYVAMVTKLLISNCGAHLVESHCKESNISDANWLRYLFSS